MFIGHDSRQGRNGEEDQISVLIDLLFADEESGLNLMKNQGLIPHTPSDEFGVERHPFQLKHPSFLAQKFLLFSHSLSLISFSPTSCAYS